MSETPEIQLTEEALDGAAAAAIEAFENAADLPALEEAHRQHLGEKAFIPQARRALGTLPKDQRKDAGRMVNMARGRVEKRFAQLRELQQSSKSIKETLTSSRKLRDRRCSWCFFRVQTSLHRTNV